jgi:type I restriction enzyme S subunit
MTHHIDTQKFKHTPIGWIPKEWEVKELGQEIEELVAGVSVNSMDDESFQPEDYLILKTSAVFDGLFNSNECKKIIEQDKERARVTPKKDCIIISRMNTPNLVGECGYVNEDHPNIFLPDRLWQTKFFKKSMVSAKWLNYLLNTPSYKLKIKSTATGTSNSMKNISKTDFLNINIPLPPLPEQRRIATLLGTWDRAIETTQKLIAQKELRKKWLMQVLLTGRLRVRDANGMRFEGEWKEHHFGEFFDERNESKNEDLPLLSIGQNGVYPQSDSIKKDTSNEDKSKYKRICPGDIGYNTMRMWQGRSALSDLVGIVSPAYTILKPRKSANSLYFAYLFQTPRLTNLFWRNSQGLVDDTLNCKYKDFSILKYRIPLYEEQTAIATILQTADSELQLHKRRLEKLKEQKKGLMQVLLTGKKRLWSELVEGQLPVNKETSIVKESGKTETNKK